MKRTAYKTKQRDQILAAVESFGGDHFSAAEAVARLYERKTPVSQSTVYRALERMCEDGTLRRYDKGGQSGSCYQLAGDSDCHSHFHLRCSECGVLLHMDCDYMQTLSEHIREHHGFDIDISRTVLYGRCENCERRHKIEKG